MTFSLSDTRKKMLVPDLGTGSPCPESDLVANLPHFKYSVDFIFKVSSAQYLENIRKEPQIF